MNDVWIVWGSSGTVVANGTDSLSHYEFDTYPELEAFLHGVEEGHNWLDYEKFSEEEDARNFVSQQIADYEAENP